MKVLVIGGTGTIGLGIIKESINKGYDTYTISRGTHNNRLPKQCNIIKGDIKKTKEMIETLKDHFFDVIFDGLVFRKANLKSSIKMYSNKCKHYIFVSTTGIYKRIPLNELLEEDTEVGRTEWEYNKGKIECEKYLNDCSNRLPFKFTIVRPSVTYGDRRIPYTIVSRTKQWSLVERIIEDKPIVAGPNVEFSVCHLDDFSRAVVGLFMNSNAYGKAFHVAGSEIIHWDDTINEISAILNKKANIIHINIELLKVYYPELYMEIKYNKADPLLLSNKNIKNTVNGFDSNVSLKEGIQRTYNTLKNEQKDTPYQYDWNLRIDSLLYLSYMNSMLDKEEMEIVSKYINTIDIEPIKKYIKRAKDTYPLYFAKQKVKRMLHAFI